MNTLNLNSSISGEYTVEIVKKNGEIYRPFGDKPLKNLILDTFFDAILRDGYRFGIQTAVQSCRIGGGPGSDTPASRTQTGLQGTEVYISHIADIFQAVVSQGGSSLTLFRDFEFPVNNTNNPVVCREALIGLFGSNVSGSDITLSRFVFPNDVVINNGEQLRLGYSLRIILQYLSNNVPITLQSGDTNLSGIVRMAATDIGIRSADPSVNSSLGVGMITSFQSNNSTTYHYRVWASNNTANFSNGTSNNSDFGSFTNIFGRGNYYNKIGFFDATHAASIAVYPTAKQAYTNLGPLGLFTSLNYTKTDSSASTDLDYYFPPHSSARSAGGIYLWYYDSSFSTTAIHLRFTESNFTTLRTATIPAGEPIFFRIKWTFNR